MSTLTVVLDRKSLHASLEAETLRIDRPGEAGPQRIPLRMVARVIVIGNPTVSCALWRALNEHAIPAVLLPSRGWGAAAHLGAGPSANVLGRVAQYRTFFDCERALAIGRKLVLWKLRAQRQVIRSFHGKTDDAGADCFLRDHRPAIRAAESRESLMGHEGAAAAAYFSFLGRILDPKWRFTGRNRRPPKDPLNAILSLSYVMAATEIRKAVQERGLDPTLGFLHAPKNGRDSFVLDVLEPLRPIIDLFCLTLLDSDIAANDFKNGPGEGCLLNKAGRRKYYAAWARKTDPEENPEPIGEDIHRILSRITAMFDRGTGISESRGSDEASA